MQFDGGMRFFVFLMLYMALEGTPALSQEMGSLLGLPLSGELTIEIEEICTGKSTPYSGHGEPLLSVVPYMGQNHTNNTKVRTAPPVFQSLPLDAPPRQTAKEQNSSHYVYKSFVLSVPMLDLIGGILDAQIFLPKKNKDKRKSSIEFFGLQIVVHKGFTPLINSRVAFNGKTANHSHFSPLLEADPTTGEIFRLDELWPFTAVLIHNHRRFVTINNGSIVSSFEHLAWNAQPECKDLPFVIFRLEVQ